MQEQELIKVTFLLKTVSGVLVCSTTITTYPNTYPNQ